MPVSAFLALTLFSLLVRVLTLNHRYSDFSVRIRVIIIQSSKEQKMKTEKSLTLNAYCFIFSVNIEWSALNGTHAKTDISAFSVNLARKPEEVGVRGQGKVAFSHALWLPLPREQSISPTRAGQQAGSSVIQFGEKSGFYIVKLQF